MTLFEKYVIVIFVVKILFICLAVYGLILRGQDTASKSKQEQQATAVKIANVNYWKERMEFIFIFMMSVMLIYIFNPRANNLIYLNREANLLLYLFGFILIITANWNVFLHESVWFKHIQGILSNR